MFFFNYYSFKYKNKKHNYKIDIKTNLCEHFDLVSLLEAQNELYWLRSIHSLLLYQITQSTILVGHNDQKIHIQEVHLYTQRNAGKCIAIGVTLSISFCMVDGLCF